MDNPVWYDPNDLQEVKKALAHVHNLLAEAIKDRDLFKKIMEDQGKSDDRYLFQHCVTAMLMNPTVQVSELSDSMIAHICTRAQCVVTFRRNVTKE